MKLTLDEYNHRSEELNLKLKELENFLQETKTLVLKLGVTVKEVRDGMLEVQLRPDKWLPIKRYFDNNPEVDFSKCKCNLYQGGDLLSVRSRNCLQNLEIKNFKDLVNKSEYEILRSKNFSKRSMKEIMDLVLYHQTFYPDCKMFA